MDIEKNLDRVYTMLINTCGCTYQEAIIVCKKAITMFKSEDKKLQKHLKEYKEIVK